VIAAALPTCDSPGNPCWNPASVSLSSGAPAGADTLIRVDDTVRDDGVTVTQRLRLPGGLRPKTLCPEPGVYGQSMGRAFGTVKVAVE
jgi:hypothetical protein